MPSQTDSHFAVCLNHKKRPQASGLIVRHLTSSWLHLVPQPLLLFFLKITWLKSTGFPKKGPMPTAGCRVFYNVCVPTSLPLCLPPFHTSSKTWYELLVHEWSGWNHSWWWWCTRVQRAEGWTHWIAIHVFPLHQFTVSLSGLSCCLKGGSC